MNNQPCPYCPRGSKCAQTSGGVCNCKECRLHGKVEQNTLPPIPLSKSKEELEKEYQEIISKRNEGLDSAIEDIKKDPELNDIFERVKKKKIKAKFESLKIDESLIKDYQHYLSQSYLRGFIPESKKQKTLKVWDVKNKSFYKNEPAVKKFGGVNGLWAYIDKQGAYYNQIDSLFQSIERKIGVFKSNLKNGNLTRDDFNFLREFVTILMMRTPSWFEKQKEIIVEELIDNHAVSKEEWAAIYTGVIADQGSENWANQLFDFKETENHLEITFKKKFIHDNHAFSQESLAIPNIVQEFNSFNVLIVQGSDDVLTINEHPLIGDSNDLMDGLGAIKKTNNFFLAIDSKTLLILSRDKSSGILTEKEYKNTYKKDVFHDYNKTIRDRAKEYIVIPGKEER